MRVNVGIENPSLGHGERLSLNPIIKEVCIAVHLGQSRPWVDVFGGAIVAVAIEAEACPIEALHFVKGDFVLRFFDFDCHGV